MVPAAERGHGTDGGKRADASGRQLPHLVHPLYHRDAFGWGEEILRHDVAELAVRDVLDVIGC